MVLFLPETSRTVVDNGSIPPPTISRLPVSKVFQHWRFYEGGESNKLRPRLPNPFNSLKILMRKDNIIIITACGLLYVIYTAINASLSVIFVSLYDLNEWEAGLIYLPFGLGGVVSTLFSGPLINNAYRNSRTAVGLPTDRVQGDDLDNFDVEKARLRLMWIPLIINFLAVVGCGWTLHYKQV